MKTENPSNLPAQTSGSAGQSIVMNHTYWAVAVGLIPIPFVDVAGVTALQLEMIKQLCKQYGIDFNEVQSKSLIGTQIAAAASNFLARLGTSALKSLPLVGSAVGSASTAVLSGASTYALGQVFLNHLDGGGTLANFDLSSVKKLYEEKVEEGKEYAKQMAEKAKESMKEEKQKAADKLKEMKEKVEKKLIPEAEYENLLAKIWGMFLKKEKE